MPHDRYVICAECPEAYKTSDIDVFLDDTKAMTLDRLDAADEPDATRRRSTSFARALLGGRTAVREEPGRRIVMKKLRPYVFKCPQGHVVDGNRGQQFPIAVLGPSGASKTHFLAGIVRSLDDMSELSRLGIKLSSGLYSNSKITDDANEIYRLNRILDPTQAEDRLLGPYGYRLRIAHRPRDPEPDEHSVLLFDVPGESLSNIMTVAEQAKFVLLCEAVIVLLDPQKFLPSSFDDSAVPTPQKRINAASDVRRGIRTIVDTLSEAWTIPAPRLKVPFCFVIAKADAVEWPPEFSWSEQTTQVLKAAATGEPLRTALSEASDAARGALSQLGGDLVIDEIESTLDPSWIRFAAASATSTMPAAGANNGSAWMADPEPQGVGLALLQVLDMAGLVASSPAPADD